MERELDLLSWQIDGVHPWPIIRMRIFHELTRRSGLHGDPHPVRRTRADQARLVGKHVAGTVTRNPFLARGSYDALVVPHPRKPSGVEIYTDSLRAELGKSALILDSGINGIPLPGSHNLDFFTSAAGAVRSRKVHARCAEIAAALEAGTGVRVPVASLVAREVPKHTRLRALYRALLKRHGGSRPCTSWSPTSISTSSAPPAISGFASWSCSTARSARTTSATAIPAAPTVADQPDELWCFGSYWTDVAELPAGMKTEVVGASFISPLSP